MALAGAESTEEIPMGYLVMIANSLRTFPQLGSMNTMGIGLYKYDGTWHRLNPNDSSNICVVGSDLYVYFSGVGLYKYDGSWKLINPNQPENMLALGSELIVDFGAGIGLYKYDGTWQRLNPNASEDMVVAELP